jgi:threonyl-tRNA synthetase
MSLTKATLEVNYGGPIQLEMVSELKFKDLQQKIDENKDSLEFKVGEHTENGVPVIYLALGEEPLAKLLVHQINPEFIDFEGAYLT